MSELDSIRQRKLNDLRQMQKSSSQPSEEERLKAQIAQIEAQVKTLFDREALTRYGTIKTAHPERAIQVLLVIAQLSQKGIIKKVDDSTLKKLLLQLTPQKREIKINRV